jgi:hypothetical protein
MPLAAMLIVSGCIFATIDPAKKMIKGEIEEPDVQKVEGGV